MATYDKDDSDRKAIELASLAIQAGLLKEINATGFDDPASAGKAAGAYLGGLIKELSAKIQSL
jgi:hypothetical protein